MCEVRGDIFSLLSSGERVSFYEYMRYCLRDEACGYYRRSCGIGAHGDFTTSPEISQIFGDCIGFWLLDLWHRLERPNRFNIVELGAGRGTLMRDILHLFKQDEQAFDAIRVYLSDINPHLQKEQKINLNQFLDKITFIGDINSDNTTLPPQNEANAVIANEFFDALAVRQFLWNGNAWQERLIQANNNKLQFVTHDSIDKNTTLLEQSLRDHNQTPPQKNEVFEYAPEAITTMQNIAKITQNGGSIIIDYGYNNNLYGDSVQAVKNHSYANILIPLNELQNYKKIPDISAHVKFKLIQKYAQLAKLKPLPLITQAEFLGSMGGAIRLQKITSTLTNQKQINQLNQAYNTIINPKNMGNLFKTQIIYHDAL